MSFPMKPYKGYSATVSFDEDALLFHGEVKGVRDVITFQASTAAELPKAFHESVDDYLEWCAQDGAEIVSRSAPRWAWDIIDATLDMDSQSKAFDGSLRESIRRALQGMILASELADDEPFAEDDPRLEDKP